MGEISTRLRICEMVYQCMPNKELSEYLKTTSDSDMSSFVTESITVVLELFMQCLGSVDHDDLPQDFFLNIHWFKVQRQNKGIG